MGSLKIWLVVVMVGLFAAAPAVRASEIAIAQAKLADKQQILLQVAQDWIEVATTQYKRGFYEPADKSLREAKEYQEYLTESQNKKLDELLEKTRTAVVERQKIFEHGQTADELIDQGELIKAKAHLKEIRNNNFLNKDERRQTEEKIEQVDVQIEQQKQEITELYQRSVELYRGCQYEEARAGFIKVAESGLLESPAGESAEDCLVHINNVMKKESEIRLPAKVDAREPVAEKVSFTEAIERKRNIVRSYSQAVINDALAKVKDHISEGRFDEAVEVIDGAKQVIVQNRLLLGDKLFAQYRDMLEELMETIITVRAQWFNGWDSKDARGSYRKTVK